MTHVRQSVVGVVIFSHLFLPDPADPEKNMLNLVNIDGHCSAHACILQEPDICDFD